MQRVQMKKVYSLLVMLLTLTVVMAVPRPASAQEETGLFFRNHTDKIIWIAVRYYPTPQKVAPNTRVTSVMPKWKTAGWWKLEPYGTVHVLSEIDGRNPYYFYAMASDGTKWGGQGNTVMWVTNVKFDYHSWSDSGTLQRSAADEGYGSLVSRANGYYPVYANAINTGDSRHYTMNLRSSDPVEHPSVTEDYAVVCLVNQTGRTLWYDFRWGDYAEWTPLSVEPYQSRWHSFPIPSGTSYAPSFEVRFDGDMSGDTSMFYYDLDSQHASSQSCNTAKQYKFVEEVGANFVQLFSMDVSLP